MRDKSCVQERQGNWDLKRGAEAPRKTGKVGDDEQISPQTLSPYDLCTICSWDLQVPFSADQ